MNFKNFMKMFDNWNGITKVNDNNLKCIVKGRTYEVVERKDLYNMEVVSFGFYDNELCVRVRPVITWDRLSEIATQALHGLLEDDKDSAMEYFRDTIELTDEEREYFGVPKENEEDDDEELECPRDFCMYCDNKHKCYLNEIQKGDFFYHEGYWVSDPMDV